MHASPLAADSVPLCNHQAARSVASGLSAYLALLAFLGVLIVRPSELIPALEPLRLALVTFCLVLLLWVFTGQRRVLLQPWVNRLAVSLLALMAISVPISCWPSRSLEELTIYLKQLTVMLLIANVVRNTSAVKWLLVVVASAQAFHAAIVVQRYLAGELVLDRVFGAAGGVFNDPNDLALNFVMMIPVCLWLVGGSQRVAGRLFVLALLGLFCLAIVLTQSRGGFLGLIVVLGLAACESRHKGLTIVAFAVGGLAFLAAAPSSIWQRYESIGQYRSDPSAMIRLHVWQAGLRMWSDHPLLGVGVGTFPIAYGTTYRDPSFASPVWYDAHNSAIKVLAELGTAGAAIWVGMILAGFVSLAAARRRVLPLAATDKQLAELSSLTRALRAALVGYLVCGMFLARSYDWMLMVFLGLTVTCAVLADERLRIVNMESAVG